MFSSDSNEVGQMIIYSYSHYHVGKNSKIGGGWEAIREGEGTMSDCGVSLL